MIAHRFFCVLERISHDQERNEHQGATAWRPRPGTSEPGRNLETSAISQERASTRATTWSASSINQGKRPGAHNSRTTRRTDARGTPGSIRPRPGTSEHQGDHLEASATTRRTDARGTPGAHQPRPGTERARGAQLTHDQADRCQGHTWRHRA